MIPDDDKISSLQVGTIVFNAILQIAILMYPGAIVKRVENDAWIIPMISGMLALISIYLICKVCNKYTKKGFVGTLKILFGKILGTLFAIPVFVYFLLYAGTEIRLFAETMKLYLLNNTPLEFIVLPILILAVFLARSGVEPMGRFFESVTGITLIVLVILFLVALPKNDYSNLRPFFTQSFTKYIDAVNVSNFSFAGFEILLILFPFARKPKETFKVSAIAVLFIALIYTTQVVQCLARFGVKETAAQIYPTMTLIRSSEIPGGIIERMEGLLMSMWVIFVFTTLVIMMFGASVVVGDLMKHKDRKHIVAMFIPFIYIIALQGQSVVDVFRFTERIMTYFEYYVAFALPLMMLVMSWIRTGGGDKDAA